MAVRAFVGDVRFAINIDVPTEFRVLAEAFYINDAANEGSVSLDESVAFGSSASAVVSALADAAVANAPTGFAVASNDVVVPNLVSG